VTDSAPTTRCRVAIIGAGPAGLFAAERLASAGLAVDIYERMPSPARKLLMAGRGGLNLTHSEPLELLLTRYRAAGGPVADAIRAFPPSALKSWAEGFGQELFTGSSGRVFPKAMKASPLLRAWLRRLDGLGVSLHVRHCFTGFDPAGRPVITGPDGRPRGDIAADAVLLACGGASWPRLGSDAAWVEPLAALGVAVTPLTAANCGALIGWSDILRQRFAGTPLKRVVLHVGAERFAGELMVTRHGLEGSPVYAAGPLLRAVLGTAPGARAKITLDLRPDLDEAQLAQRLAGPRGKQSTANWLRKAANLPPVATAMLREGTDGPALPTEPHALAQRIKRVRLRVSGLAGLERAISTAGGVALAGLDQRLMVTSRPGLFVAGEMLDWEAPTGGYLLQATFATAAMAADGIVGWLARRAGGTAADATSSLAET
jgi:uncharacterized flavoprotein (TIGR03862 family)